LKIITIYGSLSSLILKVGINMFYRFIFAVVFLFAGLAQAKDGEAKQEGVYSQHGFYAEKGVNFTTNYAAGACYPVNKKFDLLDIDHRLFGKGDTMKVVDLESGSKLDIRNVDKHTGKTIEEISARMFGDNPVDLSSHSPAIQAAIKKCDIIVGMTKEEVLLARGYPPVHETPSLDSDTWTYWYKRLSKGTINFKDNKVVSLEGDPQP
jgi:hypothetical protein